MLTTPVNTSRSWAWIVSCGVTGVIDLAVAVDFDQEQARQLPQPGCLDRAADQRAVALDQHLDQVLAPMLTQLLDNVRPVGQQTRRQKEQRPAAHQCARQSDITQFKQAHRLDVVQKLLLPAGAGVVDVAAAGPRSSSASARLRYCSRKTPLATSVVLVPTSVQTPPRIVQ